MLITLSAFANFVATHMGRQRMRNLFITSLRQQKRNEKEEVYALRKETLVTALALVEDGSLDVHFAEQQDKAPSVKNLREAILGRAVIVRFLFVFVFVPFVFMNLVVICN